MVNKNKEYVTYIENGKEVVVAVNRFNKNSLLRNKLMKAKWREEYEFYKNAGLVFIYFKNFVFDGKCGSIIFFGHIDKSLILVLDNCLFERNQINVAYFDKVQIINPRFDNSGKININCGHVNDVDVVLDKATNMMEFDISNSDKFSFVGNGNQCNLRVSASKCYLSNISNDENFNINANRLEISNSDLVSEMGAYINCDGKWINKDRELSRNIGIRVQELVLNNSNLLTDSCLEVDCSVISGKNYEIKVKGGLKFNDEWYFNCTGNEYLVLFSDKENEENMEVFARRKFISVLKGVRNVVNGGISSEVENYEKKLIKKRFTDFMK